MRFPSIRAVASVLRQHKPRAGEWSEDADENYIEVRLQVRKNGDWAVHTGDSQYDLDHRGFWGNSCLDHRSNCRELAAELIDQCKDHAAETAAFPESF
jgi:hypothetical protein